MNDKVMVLLEYLKEDGRVCPKPGKWNELWEMLPNRKRDGGGWDPPLPLILAAGWETSDSQKRERLELHIRYGAEKGVLDQIGQFFFNLGKDDWLYDN